MTCLNDYLLYGKRQNSQNKQPETFDGSTCQSFQYFVMAIS